VRCASSVLTRQGRTQATPPPATCAHDRAGGVRPNSRVSPETMRAVVKYSSLPKQLGARSQNQVRNCGFLRLKPPGLLPPRTWCYFFARSSEQRLWSEIDPRRRVASAAAFRKCGPFGDGGGRRVFPEGC
jgi:hypothetical protein